MKKNIMLLAVLLGAISASTCTYPTTSDEVTGSNNQVTSSAHCSSGSCFIRSANVCCPYGYLNYGGAASGCFATQQACLNSSGGKCWYETSCIP